MQAPQAFWTVLTIVLGVIGAAGVFYVPGIDHSTAVWVSGLILGAATGLPVKPPGAPSPTATSSPSTDRPVS